jgi:hypothetical protein
MDQKDQGLSLIPKEYTYKGEEKAKGFDFIKLFGNIFFGLFLLSMLTYGGMFIYKKYFLAQEIVDQTQVLETIKKLPIFQKDLETIKNQDQKLIALTDLLTKHIFVSNLFKYMEKHTHENVRFKAFGYKKTEKSADITLNAESKDVLSISKQMISFTTLLAVMANPDILGADLVQKEKDFKDQMGKYKGSNEKIALSGDIASLVADYIATAKAQNKDDAKIKAVLVSTGFWKEDEAALVLKRYGGEDTRAISMLVGGYSYDIIKGVYNFDVSMVLPLDFVETNFNI